MKYINIISLFILCMLPTAVNASFDSNQIIAISQLDVQQGSSKNAVDILSIWREQHQETKVVQSQQNSRILLAGLVDGNNKPLIANAEDGTITSTSEEEAESRVSLRFEDGEMLGEDEYLFGKKMGYFHPYIRLKLELTDNLFNLDEDRVSNFLTKISPGIWLAAPRKKLVPVAIATHNQSAGGLEYMLDDYLSYERYQLYLKGALDYSIYSEDSELNDLEWRVEAMGRYNFPGGLSLQLIDQYTRSQDRYELGYPDSTLLHLFYSNVLIGTADWEITEKFRVKGDVSLFFLRYDDVEFDFLERDDIFIDLYGYFNWSEKTSFFLNYKFGRVGFDSFKDYDNEQNFIYGGVKWDSTEKLALLFKIGLQDKQYTNEDSTFTNHSGIALEGQVDYRFSEKTRFQFAINKKNDETDTLLAENKDVWGANFNYGQDFTDKLHGAFKLRYEFADYTEIDSQERNEWRITLEPTLRYAFLHWMNVELGYRYETRDSTDDKYDYYSNTVFLNLNLKL